MKIRKATKKDLKDIANLMTSEYLKHYQEKWKQKDALKTLEYYLDVGEIFLAEIEGKLAGFVIICKEFCNRSSVIVEELVVDGKFQRKGLGSKLIDFTQDYCKKNKIHFIWLMAVKRSVAFKFYKKLGYKYNKSIAYFSKELK
jgi:ribosomal protein S18 acetylase RimI-like enzyme